MTTLFPDDAQPLLPRASRQRDPDTSLLAERDITADGSRERMMQVALEAVRRWPGRTSNELEALTGLGDGKIRKRLNDLWRKGLIRKGEKKVSEVSGKWNETWYMAGAHNK